MNADTFNSRYPVGTPVFAYPGCRPEDDRKATRLVTRTRSEAQLFCGHTDVVWVDGHSACIALSHVDVVSESVWKAAREAETAAAVASEGALPMPVGSAPTVEELQATIARLRRDVASLTAEQDRCDAEYATAIAERARYRLAWQSARGRVQRVSAAAESLANERNAYVAWLENAELQLVDANRISDWRAIGRDA